MSAVLTFHRSHQPKPRQTAPRHRPPDALIHIAALVSSIESRQIETVEELRDAIFILDLANTCINLFVKQIERGAAREHLLEQSAKIGQLITAARCEIAQL